MRKSNVLLSTMFIVVLLFCSVAFCAPAVTLSPTVIAGQDVASQSFRTKNDGGGALNYTITSNAAWAILGTSFGGASNETNLITIKYATSSLAVGTYSATITVDDPAVSNSPQTVLINLSVMPKPTIGIIP